MRHVLGYLRRRFAAGMLIILPISITIWIFLRIFNFVDSILGDYIDNLIGRRIPGLGLLVTLLLILFAGIIASNVFGHKLTKSVENLIMKVPLIKTIYGPVKDVFSNLTQENSSNFKKVVFVTYPLEGSHSIGFITKEAVTIGGVVKTAIFIPTTPNPTSGFLVYLSKDAYEELDLPVDIALKMIISLGTVSPNAIQYNHNKLD